MALVLVVALLFSISYRVQSTAATPADFANTNSAIQSAFVATSNAEQSGGNTSSLLLKLNAAISLMQEAQAENSTSPTQAALNLSNATSIAQQVSSEAPSVARAGSAAKQLLDAESISGAVLIVAIAALLYIYGGRIYRRIWFWMYRSHVVKPGNGE